GRLDVAVLNVDHPRRDVPPGVRDLAQEPDLAHLAVRELEDELIDGEAEHRVEDRAVGARRERTTEEVAETEMNAEAGPPDGRLERGVEETDEVGRGVGVDRGRRLVDLDDVGAGIHETAEFRRDDRNER